MASQPATVPKSKPPGWLRKGLGLLVTFFPVLFVVALLLSYKEGYIWARLCFGYLNSIDGNEYVLHDILLLCIISANMTVVIGFVSYLRALFKGLVQYDGEDRKFFGKIGFVNMVVILVILFLCISYVWFVVASLFNRGGWFTFHHLVDVNRWMTPVVFFLFLLSDILTYWANAKSKTKDPTKNDKERVAEAKAAWDSIWYINLPVLIVSLFSIGLGWIGVSMRQLTGSIDQSLFERPFVAEQTLDMSMVHLFLSGLESGMIFSTIVYSQIVFIVIMNRKLEKPA